LKKKFINENQGEQRGGKSSARSYPGTEHEKDRKPQREKAWAEETTSLKNNRREE